MDLVFYDINYFKSSLFVKVMEFKLFFCRRLGVFGYNCILNGLVYGNLILRSMR